MEFASRYIHISSYKNTNCINNINSYINSKIVSANSLSIIYAVLLSREYVNIDVFK